MSAIPGVIRKKVHERDGGRCVRCGGQASDLHHRQRRREGGHVLSNLISLCGRGNTSGCHGWAHSHPAEARDEGFIVSAWGDPLTQWVWRWDGARVLFDDEGGITFVPMGDTPEVSA